PHNRASTIHQPTNIDGQLRSLNRDLSPILLRCLRPRTKIQTCSQETSRCKRVHVLSNRSLNFSSSMILESYLLSAWFSKTANERRFRWSADKAASETRYNSFLPFYYDYARLVSIQC